MQKQKKSKKHNSDEYTLNVKRKNNILYKEKNKHATSTKGTATVRQTHSTNNNRQKTKNNKGAYALCLSNTQPNIIFVEYKRTQTRMNKFLKPYTQCDDTREQLIKLWEQPLIIQDKPTTRFIVEVIYITPL